jgi:hypothetical protein
MEANSLIAVEAPLLQNEHSYLEIDRFSMGAADLAAERTSR